MSWGEYRVAVVVPIYNEGSALREVVATIPAYVDSVILVDDGSQPPVSAELKRDFPRVELLRHPENRGVGAAIASGYAQALRQKADIVAVMGADGQMAPDELAPLVEAIACGEADYAKGNRFMGGGAFRAMPLMRYLGNIALSLATRAITGYRLFDSQCGFTAISAETLRRLPLGELYPRYGVPNDILARLANLGARVCERPVTPLYPPRHTHMNLWKIPFTLGPLLLRLALRREVKPTPPVSGAADEHEVADVPR